MLRWLAVVALAGCGPPPLSIVLEIAGGDAQTCPSTDCTEVFLGCDPYYSLRIVDLRDPNNAVVDLCDRLSLDRTHDVCSLTHIEVPVATRVPAVTLDVQVIVYPRDQLTLDPTINPTCPGDISFDSVTGAPFEKNTSAPGAPGHHPAIGGHGIYHDGETETVVSLGCSDLSLVDSMTCDGVVTTSVTATAVDFDNRLTVTTGIAGTLIVGIGEPTPSAGNTYELLGGDLKPLTLDKTRSNPTWFGDVEQTFMHGACLEILADGGTATLTCIHPAPGPIDIQGVWLSTLSLGGSHAGLLGALGLTEVPAQGLVIGIVVDEALQPLDGVTVVPTAPGKATATIEYLTPLGNGIVPGGTATTTSGVFVSQDAPYGTMFAANGGINGTFQPVLGGLVTNKVTIVLLQRKQVSN